jgi:catechol 2,3-dioxygenase-like lactoylglutathione lyase family enzyme
MAVKRMHHIGVVVEDLDRAKAFFLAVGLLLDGEQEVSGDWVGAVIGLDGVRSRIAFLRAPGSDTALELTEFVTPVSPPAAPPAAPNVLGLRHLAFPVDDLDETLGVVRGLGFGLMGSVQEGGGWRLCYIRGPEGLIIELAEGIT